MTAAMEISAESAFGGTKLVWGLVKQAFAWEPLLPISVSATGTDAQQEQRACDFAELWYAQQLRPVSVSVKHRPCGSAPHTETATSVTRALKRRNLCALRNIVNSSTGAPALLVKRKAFAPDWPSASRCSCSRVLGGCLRCLLLLLGAGFLFAGFLCRGCFLRNSRRSSGRLLSRTACAAG